VAIGIALDSTYSYLSGMLPQSDWSRTLSLLSRLGFSLYVPELEHQPDSPKQERSLFRGLQEFREHLGGELTLTLLEGIGNPIEVHLMDQEVLIDAIRILRESDWITTPPRVTREDICEQISL
jgi:3-dehydroquinate synthase